MFLKKLTAAGDSATSQQDLQNVNHIAIVTTPDGSDTYAQSKDRANYPTVSITAQNSRGEQINICVNVNLLDLLEIDAQESGAAIFNPASTGTGINGVIAVCPDVRGVDLVNFQLTLSGWPAAATGAVREVDVYAICNDPTLPSSGKVLVYTGYANAATSFSAGGANQEIYVLASSIISFSNACGTSLKQEMISYACNANEAVLTDGTGTATPVMGFMNLLPVYPDGISTQLSFSGSGTYIKRETLG